MKTASVISDISEPEENLLLGDAFTALDSVEDKTVQLVVTSPPYNIGKVYERDEEMSLEQYLDWLRPIIKKICSKVSDEGSVCWQVGNFVKDGQVFPLDYFFYQIFIDNGFKLRNRIIWKFNFGLHALSRLSGRYETLLWFTKSDNYVFNLDPIRIPQIYPGKRHSKSKGELRAGKPSGNPLGKNPSDFWVFDPNLAFNLDPIWDIPNVKANHPEKTLHPCQFPHELVERCILAFSNEGDTVLDPFMGVGTTVIGAVKAGRNAMGIDKAREYVNITRDRLENLRKGTLKLRASGMHVLAPDQRDQVARIPKEWEEASG